MNNAISLASELTIRVAGEAGQGTQTIGSVLCNICKISGLYVFAHQDYMSRIRGGNNFIQIRIAAYPVCSPRQDCDIIVALNKESVEIHRNSLVSDGLLIADKGKFGFTGPDAPIADVPLFNMAMENGGKEIFVNSVACGLLAEIIGLSFEPVEKVLAAVFGKKGEDIIKANVKAARSGYDFGVQNFKASKALKPGNADPQSLLLDGNEAIALAAIAAGCKFYSAYPMTPSTSIMDTLCTYAGRFNIVVEQAEDEIAAVNMVIGASFAGVRAMTGTSGGGFALMAEGISLAAMTETPLVVVDGQRPAPATGFPTRTEQADLNFVIHAGHGEFARIVYAPGTAEEAFSVIIQAFELSEKYQIPALILTDQHLADSVRNITAFSLAAPRVKRHIILKNESGAISNYKRYAYTESGVSPRAIPSWINDIMYVDSDEHTEDGHITEDAQARIQMVDKRFTRKTDLLKEEIRVPSAGNIENADVILVGFGSNFGVMKEVAETEKTMKIGFIHLSQVWPFPAREVSGLLANAKKIVTVENNAGAQFAGLLRRETGIVTNSSILKYDGRPFSFDVLKRKLNEGK